MPRKHPTRPAGILAAAMLAATSITAAQNVPVQKYTLRNGLTVILHEDHTLPRVTINTWYHVGSKDEPPHRSGFAHLFEHLMFMGTNRVPTGMFDKIMEGAGGNNNASTTEDRTNFYSVGPSNLLPTLLYLDADRLEDLAKAMDQKKLDLQRQVVLNERRQNTENAPYGKAYEAINGLMFPEGHPYHTSVIGSREDIEQASVQNVVDFFHTFYVPNNASLVVAGDFRPAKIKPIIAKLFGTIPRGNDVVRKPVQDFTFHSQRVTMVDQVQYSKTILAWHSPAAYKDGDIQMQIAAAVLSDGISSRLYKRLITQDKLATDVSAFEEPRLLGSVFYVDVTAAQGVSQDKLEYVIEQELHKLRATGPTAAELDRVKAKILFSLMNSLQSVDAKADKLNEFEFYFHQPNSFKRVLSEFQAATPESVRKTVQAVLNPATKLTLRVIPQTPAPAVNPRDVAPGISPISPFNAAQPKRFSLSNGIKVFYWRRPELPLMSIGMLLDGGADIDPQSESGRAEMTASMLDEGSGSMDAEQFQNALDQLGASFSASAGHQTSTASMSVIAPNFGPAAKLYADAICRPRFIPKEWQRIQRTTIADLQQQLDDAGTVARRVGMSEYFGWSNPYGRPISGTADSLKKLNLDALRQEYRTIYQPQHATIFVAGSLPEAQVHNELNREFGAWKGSGRPLPKVTYSAPVNTKFRVVIVNKPAAVQTVVRFIMPAPTYASPNRTKLNALSTILGGSFTSRLNQNLRETHGYTYGAGSAYVFEDQVGYLIASSDVRTDVTGPSITEFLKEFKGLRSGNVTDQDVVKAMNTMTSDVVQSMGSIQSTLGTAMALYSHGKPFSQLGFELRDISLLDAGSLNRLADGAIPLEEGLLVLVGDKDQILSQIASLGLPQPTIVKAQ